MNCKRRRCLRQPVTLRQTINFRLLKLAGSEKSARFLPMFFQSALAKNHKAEHMTYYHFLETRKPNLSNGVSQSGPDSSLKSVQGFELGLKCTRFVYFANCSLRPV